MDAGGMLGEALPGVHVPAYALFSDAGLGQVKNRVAQGVEKLELVVALEDELSLDQIGALDVEQPRAGPGQPSMAEACSQGQGEEEPRQRVPPWAQVIGGGGQAGHLHGAPA